MQVEICIKRNTLWEDKLCVCISKNKKQPKLFTCTGEITVPYCDVDKIIWTRTEICHVAAAVFRLKCCLKWIWIKYSFIIFYIYFFEANKASSHILTYLDDIIIIFHMILRYLCPYTTKPVIRLNFIYYLKDE